MSWSEILSRQIDRKTDKFENITTKLSIYDGRKQKTSIQKRQNGREIQLEERAKERKTKRRRMKQTKKQIEHEIVKSQISRTSREKKNLQKLKEIVEK